MGRDPGTGWEIWFNLPGLSSDSSTTNGCAPAVPPWLVIAKEPRKQEQALDRGNGKMRQEFGGVIAFFFVVLP